jgi:Tfp pilus assembly protein PilN
MKGWQEFVQSLPPQKRRKFIVAMGIGSLTLILVFVLSLLSIFE